MTNFVANTGGTLILQVLQFEGGPLEDLDAAPTITITNIDTGVVAVGPTTVGVNHPATGVYTYAWGAVVSAGTYLVVWNGTLLATPYQGSEFVSVYSAAGAPVGPCDGWTIDPGCCPDWLTLSSDLRAAASAYATTVLWAATGRRFGLCTRTVRPCGRECSTGFGNYGYYWSEGTWMPYIFNGVWRNCWAGCSFGCCTCEPQCQVYLPGPVAAVVNVTVDGNLIDPTTYRVDNGIWLVRTHDVSTDDCWPLCQDYNLSSGAGVFEVTYLKGIAVPSPLLRAAGELACEWVKSCQGLPCRLPQRVTSIARQGVSISMVDVDMLLEKGLTGVQTVDQLIRTYNPYGLVSEMKIHSPDLTVERTTTYP